MARKGSQPALYELIRTRSAAPPQRALPPAGFAHIEPGPSPAPAAAAPARVVRLPVGYLYAGAAIVLLAVVVSYLYGVSVGERVARERLAQQRVEELNAAGHLPAADPLGAGRTPPSLRQDAGGAAPAGGESSRAAPARSADGVAGGALGPPPGTDPRVPGLNYFVLAHTSSANGGAMVEFCRRNGLDAHLVPDYKGNLRLVIVTPGFAAGERQSAAVKQLEAKIRAVGLQWKGAARGNRDFGDAYPEKFQPRQPQ